MSSWTPAAEAELVRLFEAGLTYAAIAIRLGVTRNAVTGRLRRLNVPTRGGEARSQKPRYTRRGRLASTVSEPSHWGKARAVLVQAYWRRQHEGARAALAALEAAK